MPTVETLVKTRVDGVEQVRRRFRKLEDDLNKFGKLADRVSKNSRSRFLALVPALRRVGNQFRTLGRVMRGIGRRLINFKTAILGIAGIGGVGLLAKSFINVASETEQLQIRLTHLLGSADEGRRMFKDLADFASRVPFEFREIAQSATMLSGVMAGGRDQINDMLPRIADLATVSGLSIQQTTEQVMRLWSAGIGAADLFRERGITAMMGFTAGVKTSVEDSRKGFLAFTESITGASQDMARSWQGIMSMFSDAWFQFQDRLMRETTLFDFIKELARGALGEFQNITDISQSQMQMWAEVIQGFILDTIDFFLMLADVIVELAGHIGTLIDISIRGATAVGGLAQIGGNLVQGLTTTDMQQAEDNVAGMAQGFEKLMRAVGVAPDVFGEIGDPSNIARAGEAGEKIGESVAEGSIRGMREGFAKFREELQEKIQLAAENRATAAALSEAGDPFAVENLIADQPELFGTGGEGGLSAQLQGQREARIQKETSALIGDQELFGDLDAAAKQYEEILKFQKDILTEEEKYAMELEKVEELIRNSSNALDEGHLQKWKEMHDPAVKVREEIERSTMEMDEQIAINDALIAGNKDLVEELETERAIRKELKRLGLETAEADAEATAAIRKRIETLRKQEKVIDNLKDSEKDIEQFADIAERKFDQAIGSIGNAWETMFFNVVENGKFEFGSFIDAVKDAWKRMLISLVAESSFKLLLGGLGLGPGLSFGGAAGGAGLGSLFGGAGAAGLGALIPGLGIAAGIFGAGKLFGVFHEGGQFDVGGGSGNQLVSFLAKAGERVSVATPAQQAFGTGPASMVEQPDIHVTVNFNGIDDFTSFRQSQGQITAELSRAIMEATRRNM